MPAAFCPVEPPSSMRRCVRAMYEFRKGVASCRKQAMSVGGLPYPSLTLYPSLD